jgi:sugar lactone lactonase YvrE
MSLRVPSRGWSIWSTVENLVLQLSRLVTQPMLPTYPRTASGHELRMASSIAPEMYRSIVGRVVRMLSIAAVVAVSSCRAEAVYNFITFAGAPVRGAIDGVGNSTRFNFPFAVAAAANGDIFVADTLNNTIRKVTPNGIVTTIAGSPGTVGSADGVGSVARFNSPNGLAVDTAGYVFVADTWNHSIRKISPTGVVTTLAGSGARGNGFADGTGTSARFNFPEGVAVDANGSVYVADTRNNTIRKVTPDGVVTTFVGAQGLIGLIDGAGSQARFFSPSGLAADESGNVYVADSNNSAIRKITPSGVVTTLAGDGRSQGSADGVGREAQFFIPKGVAVDRNGNVFVADTVNNTVRKISSSGVVITFAGAAIAEGTSDGVGPAARFNSPHGITIDRNGNIIVSDTNNHTIRKISPERVVTTIAGPADRTGTEDGIGAAARFSEPVGVASDELGNIFVADRRNRTIRKISSSGAVTTLAGSAGAAGFVNGAGASARFDSPTGIAVDAQGNVFVSDGGTTIRKITSGGVVTTLAGTSGLHGAADGPGSTATFSQAWGLAIDGSGNVFVADSIAHTIRKIDPAGVVSTIAGSTGVIGSTDGIGSAARFNFPSALTVDVNNNLFVADARNSAIRKISPDGLVTTWAGGALVEGNADGVGNAARFGAPYGITVDKKGNVFVADTNYSTIRKIDVNARVTTIGGLANSSDTVDGKGTAARFDSPWAIVVDRKGDLYIADATGQTIRKGIAPVSRLGNLSVRSRSGVGADTLIVGFNLSGRGGNPILVRGIGPALAAFGINDFISDPTLRLDASNGALIAQNDNWDSNDAVGIALTTANVGAFALQRGARDAGLLITLNQAGYTARLGGGTGIGLIEIYEADSAADAQLTNLSARTRSGAGADVLIVGFVIAGDAEKTLLVRAVGPSLNQFGIVDPMADPRLTLFFGPTVIAANDNWSADIAQTFTSVGAFALPAGSRDAAMVVTLNPGSYTAQVNGVGNDSGIALVEVYEIP